MQQIVWAKGTVEGDQTGNDGSRLLNWFAVKSEMPEQAKSPLLLYPTPGKHKAIRLAEQAVNGRTLEGINALVPVDSAVYGRRLLGILGAASFFEVRAGHGALNIQGDPGITDTYNPILDESGEVVYPADAELPAEISRITNFSNAATAAQAKVPMRVASDGRYSMFVQARNVKCWDLGKTGGSGFVDVPAPVADDQARLLPDEQWVDVVHSNGHFVLAARGGQLFSSEVNQIEFDQLDFASAEKNPDPIVGLAEFASRIYVFGTKSVEQFTYRGTLGFPFARDTTFNIPIGCASLHTIHSDERNIYFVGSDNIVYVLSGSRLLRISTQSIEQDLKSAYVGDTRAYTYTEDGHSFYVLTIPLRGGGTRVWVFDDTTGFWHERSDTSVLCVARFLGLNFIGEQEADFVSLLSRHLVTSHDSRIVRIAETPVIHGGHQAVSFPFLLLDVETGRAKDPDSTEPRTFRLRWSDDAKRVYAAGLEKRIENGFTKFTQLGQTVDGRNFHLQTDADITIIIKAAYVETLLRLGNFGAGRIRNKEIPVLSGPTIPANPRRNDLWLIESPPTDPVNYPTGIYISVADGGPWTRLGDLILGAGAGLVVNGTNLDVNVGDGVEISNDKVRIKLDGDTLIRAEEGVKLNIGTPQKNAVLQSLLATGNLRKSVAGNQNRTLTATEAAYDAIEFVGLLTWDIIVSIPASPAGVRLLKRSTTGNYSLKVKVAGEANSSAIELPPGVNIVQHDGVRLTLIGVTQVADFGALAFAADLTWDLEALPNAIVTLTADVTRLRVTNPDFKVHTLLIRQDATGNRTFAFPDEWSGPSGSILSGANEETLLTIRRIGAIFHAAPLLKNS